MNSFTRLLLISTVLVIGTCAGGLIAYSLRRPGQGLLIASEKLNAGEVFIQPAFPWTLPITNATKKSITIDRFRLSCSCTSIEPSSLTIDPGQTREARIVVDLTSNRQDVLARPRWKLAINVVPDSQSFTDGSRYNWGVLFDVINPLSFSKHTAGPFVRDPTRKSSSAEATIAIVSQPVIEHLVARCADSDLAISLAENPRQLGQYELHVVPSASMSGGQQEHLIWFETESSDLKRRLKLPYYLQTIILDPVVAQPNPISFSPSTGGDTVTTDFILRTRIGKNFRLANEKSTDEIDFAAKDGLQDDKFAAERHYRLSLVPKKLGLHTGSLDLRLLFEGCEIEYPLSLKYDYWAKSPAPQSPM